MKEEELKNLQLLRQSSPRAETAYHLVKTFLQMVRERTGEQLDAWLEEVKANHLEALVLFIKLIAGMTVEKEGKGRWNLAFTYQRWPLENTLSLSQIW